MTWVIYGIWFFTVSLIPLVATIIVYFKLKKYLWAVPVSGVIFAIVLAIRDTIKYMPPGVFLNKFITYFTDKISISFYVFYLPIALLSMLYPGVFYLIGRMVQLACKSKK